MQSNTNLEASGNPIGWALSWSHDEARRVGERVIEVLRACADGYAVAAEYEELSKLSKEELERRGIPHGDLPQHIFEALTQR
jgi:hypothetical protein